MKPIAFLKNYAIDKLKPEIGDRVTFEARRLAAKSLRSFQAKVTTREMRTAARERGYKAAKITRLLADLKNMGGNANANIRGAWMRLVEMSRELARNSDYMLNYLNILENNIAGPNGITLQPQVKNKKGDLDKVANDDIETSFNRWAEKGNCTVCGGYSFTEVQQMAVTSEATDGEVLIRMVPGFNNEWGFALQVLEADHLHIGFNERITVAAGNYIDMSIEFDKWSRPQRYHLLTRHPGADVWKGTDGRLRLAVSARELLHIFTRKRPGQIRGVPWTHSALLRLNHLTSYEEAELIAARVAASQMGFFTREADPGTSVDDEDDDGTGILNAEPGSFFDLPPGVDFKAFDPKHPTGAFDKFVEKTLRGIAAGLGVPYHTLANDLKGVNLSSARIGELEARSNYRKCQKRLVNKLLTPVYRNWLMFAALSDLKGKISIMQLEKYHDVAWQPRGWEYINPVQGIKADIVNIDHGLKSFDDVSRERYGRPYAVPVAQLAKDKETQDNAGIKVPVLQEQISSTEVNTDAFK